MVHLLVVLPQRACCSSGWDCWLLLLMTVTLRRWSRPWLLHGMACSAVTPGAAAACVQPLLDPCSSLGMMQPTPPVAACMVCRPHHQTQARATPQLPTHNIGLCGDRTHTSWCEAKLCTSKSISTCTPAHTPAYWLTRATPTTAITSHSPPLTHPAHLHLVCCAE